MAEPRRRTVRRDAHARRAYRPAGCTAPPADAADVLPTDLHLAHPQGRIIAVLTRLVAVELAAWLFVVVTTPAGGRLALWSPTLGDQVAIVAVTAHGDSETPSSRPSTSPTPNEIDSAGPPRLRTGQVGNACDVTIVPNGVTRVRWTFRQRRLATA